MKKLIKINGNDFEYTQKYEKVICIIPTGCNAIKLSDEKYNPFEIKFGQICYDFHILKSGSNAFKLEKNSKELYSGGFNILFAKVNNDVLNIIIQAEEKIQKIKVLRDELNKSLEVIEKISKTKIKY